MPALLKNKLFYGWVVIIAGLGISITSFGIRYSFGVFFKSIESEFGLTRGATSSIFSTYMILSAVFAVVGGWAMDRYGPKIVSFVMGLLTGLSLLLVSQTDSLWQLFITYGLILALGTGATFTVVNSTVSRWFDKKRGFALGISTSGGPLGAVVMAPFATYLIANFDWRIAFMVMGIIALLVMSSLSLFLGKDPGEVGLLPDGVKSESAEIRLQKEKSGTQPPGLSLLQALRTSNFWFLGFVWFCLSLSVHLILTHTIPHAIDIGISPMDAAFVVSLIGITCVLGRLVVGRVSDSIGRKIPSIVSASLQVVALIWLIWAQDLWMLYLFAVVFGFSWGGLGTMVTVLIGDIFGMRSIGVIMGAMVVYWALGGAVGPPLGGVIFDVAGNYFMAFVMGAVIMFIAVLFVALTGRKVNI